MLSKMLTKRIFKATETEHHASQGMLVCRFLFKCPIVPAVGARSPAVGAGSPAVGAGSPAVGARNPVVGDGSPAVGAGSPTVGAGSPAVGAGSLRIACSCFLRRICEGSIILCFMLHSEVIWQRKTEETLRFSASISANQIVLPNLPLWPIRSCKGWRDGLAERYAHSPQSCFGWV